MSEQELGTARIPGADHSAAEIERKLRVSASVADAVMMDAGDARTLLAEMTRLRKGGEDLRENRKRLEALLVRSTRRLRFEAFIIALECVLLGAIVAELIP